MANPGSQSVDREPVFNAPVSVIRCLAALAIVHVVLWHLLPLVADETAGWIAGLLAFNPARYRLGGNLDLYNWGAAVWSFVTHQVVHGDVTHLLLNSAWLLVFGGAIAQRIGGWRYLALAVLSGIAGAILFLLFRIGENVPMVGASGAVSGLMGGAFRFFFAALDRGGFATFRDNPKSIPLMSVRQTLADRRLQIAAGVLVLINVLTVLGSSSLTSADGIAWESHLGGFLFGLLGFQMFEPPARPRLEIVRPTLH